MSVVIKESKERLDVRLLVSGIIIGLTSGLVVVVYRYLLAKIEELIAFIADLVHKDLMVLLLYALALLIVGLILHYFIKKEKLISGSGIPQVEAEISGLITSDHLKVLVYKFFGGILSALAGLSLGREGPSIQIGAMVSGTIGKRFKILDKDLLLTSGAASGLAAAFSAPLSAVLFSLEELHRNFNTKVLIVVMASAVSADFIASYIFGMQATFDFMISGTIALKYYPYVLILGIITGLIGVFYNNVTLLTQRLFLKLPSYLRLGIPLCLAIVLLYGAPMLLGGGHHLLAYITIDSSIWLLIVLLAMKLIFSFVSFASGAPGGIFFPLLVNGALVGAIFALVLIELGLIDTSTFYHFVTLAMAAYFTAIVRAPITGIILIFEMTGNITNLLPLILCSIIAYLVADLLRCKPIYESLLERYEIKEGTEAYEVKTITLCVEYGSKAIGKAIKDIKWPKGAQIVKVERHGKEIIASGDLILASSDMLDINVDIALEAKIREELDSILR